MQSNFFPAHAFSLIHYFKRKLFLFFILSLNGQINEIKRQIAVQFISSQPIEAKQQQNCEPDDGEGKSCHRADAVPGWLTDNNGLTYSDTGMLSAFMLYGFRVCALH